MDLTDKKQPICEEMFNFYHGTLTMKNEDGIVPRHSLDSAILKRPLNQGDMVQNVNSNPDLFDYMTERIVVPAIFNL